MALRGIRGAIAVKKNSKKEILGATKKLLKKLIAVNEIKAPDVASAIFSVTADLNAEFPAIAAREELGWLYTPLLCVNEIPVPGSLKRCIRVLIHINTTKKQAELKNVYLGEAKKLRPDLKTEERGLYYLSNS